MFFLFGTRPRGRVHVAHGGYVETDFFCVQMVPIVPLGSYFVDTEQHRRRALRSVPTSIVAGYVRGWLAVPVVIGLICAFVSGVREFSVGAIALPLVMAAPFMIPLWAARYIGRFSDTETLECEAYARVCGASVDVALLEDAEQDTLRASLLETMDSETRALMNESYRGGVGAPELAYASVATGLATPSLDYLCGALALTRIDMARAPKAERGSLRRTFDAILARVSSFAND